MLKKALRAYNLRYGVSGYPKKSVWCYIDLDLEYRLVELKATKGCT